MAVCGIARNEDATGAIGLSHRIAQLPEARVIDLAYKIETGGAAQGCAEVEALSLGVARHRSVEEETLPNVDAAEELPITLQIRMQHAIGRARRKALELLVQLLRAKHDQH